MSNKVKKLYDTLFEFEKGRDSSNEGYPIHKALSFEHDDINDIYHWLIHQIDFSQTEQILDAGCGVGYGTMIIANNCNAQLTGISLSPLEIERATKNASSQGLIDRVQFIVSDFENAPDKNYDIIIAIESLKHSFDLGSSLKALTSSLSDGGRLIIIEDFYTGEENGRLKSKYVHDWDLHEAYQFSDYEKQLGTDNQYIDLTEKMPKKNALALSLKERWFNALRIVNKQNQVHKIFRGGIYMDKLYAENKMRYGCLIYTNTQKHA